MKFRRYAASDIKEIAELFYQTVHTVNRADYTEEQLSVWATGNIDLDAWNSSLSEHNTIVAVLDEEIVGFATLTEPDILSGCTFIRSTRERVSPQRYAMCLREPSAERNSPLTPQ